jgi:hypothetical protein
MTQRANSHILIGLQNTRNEMAADFAGRSSHQNALHGFRHSNGVDDTGGFKSVLGI